MNRNEESSLPGITSMPSISRHAVQLRRRRCRRRRCLRHRRRRRRRRHLVTLPGQAIITLPSPLTPACHLPGTSHSISRPSWRQPTQILKLPPPARSSRSAFSSQAAATANFPTIAEASALALSSTTASCIEKNTTYCQAEQNRPPQLPGP